MRSFQHIGCVLSVQTDANTRADTGEAATGGNDESTGANTTKAAKG